MKCLLNSKKLIFGFTSDYVSCITVDHYQINGILSFAILDLAYKIIRQRKRKYIALKKRKPIIHLLNYIDALNFNSKEFNDDFFLKNLYKTELVGSLYHYQKKYFKDLDYKDKLEVIVSENSCTIRFDYHPTTLSVYNANLVAMITHILRKEKDAINESRTINVSGIMFYCLFLM